MKAGLRVPLLLLCASLTACSWFKSSSAKEPPVAPGPQLVGRIASIPPGKRFVLIQSFGSWKLEAGTILTTRGTEERTANLLTTGEVLGQFAAADVQSGSVEVGDAVYSRHTIAPVATPSAEGAETKPAATTPENISKTT